jgi:hypothetical protein
MAGNMFKNVTTDLSSIIAKLRPEPGAYKKPIMLVARAGISKKPASGENIVAMTAISVALPLFPVFLFVVVLTSHYFRTHFL